MGRSPLEGDLFSNVRTRLIGEPQVGSSRNIRDKPQAATALSPRDFVIRRDGFAFEHEFVKRLQPADTCDVAAPQRGPVALNDVARVSTIPIRGGYLIRQSTMCRLLALRGLRRLRGVRWMCTSLVGCRAAASNVFLSAAAGQATSDTTKAAAQRRRACRNTARQ